MPHGAFHSDEAASRIPAAGVESGDAFVEDGSQFVAAGRVPPAERKPATARNSDQWRSR